jgi:hypothetical protein
VGLIASLALQIIVVKPLMFAIFIGKINGICNSIFMLVNAELFVKLCVSLLCLWEVFCDAFSMCAVSEH